MATSRSSSRTLLWLLVVLVVLTSSAAAVAFFMLFTQPGDGQAEAAPAPAAPIFLEIAPFTVNLAEGDHGPRLLYAGISLKLDDERSHDLLKTHMPQVRSRLLTLLSGQQAAELTSPDGKQRLAERVRAALETPMSPAQPEAGIEDVLFTEFIVQ